MPKRRHGFSRLNLSKRRGCPSSLVTALPQRLALPTHFPEAVMGRASVPIPPEGFPPQWGWEWWPCGRPPSPGRAAAAAEHPLPLLSLTPLRSRCRRTSPPSSPPTRGPAVRQARPGALSPRTCQQPHRLVFPSSASLAPLPALRPPGFGRTVILFLRGLERQRGGWPAQEGTQQRTGTHPKQAAAVDFAEEELHDLYSINLILQPRRVRKRRTWGAPIRRLCSAHLQLTPARRVSSLCAEWSASDVHPYAPG